MGEFNTMSINFLDPEKCRFYINPNGFTALKTEDKDYRRVRLLRTLPLHRPFEYISVSDMDKNEIGIIKNAADFPTESREIIEKDLAARYYCPQISEIYSKRHLASRISAATSRCSIPARSCSPMPTATVL